MRRVGLGRSRLYLDLAGRGGLSVVASRKSAGGVPGSRRAIGRPRRGENPGARRFGRPISARNWRSSIRSCSSGSDGPKRNRNRAGRMKVWAGEMERRRVRPGAILRARLCWRACRRLGAAARRLRNHRPAVASRRGQPRPRGRAADDWRRRDHPGTQAPGRRLRRRVQRAGGRALSQRNSGPPRPGERDAERALSRHPAQFAGRQRLRAAERRDLRHPRPAGRSPTTRRKWRR